LRRKYPANSRLMMVTTARARFWVRVNSVFIAGPSASVSM
jgi:hypothetical protein